VPARYEQRRLPPAPRPPAAPADPIAPTTASRRPQCSRHRRWRGVVPWTTPPVPPPKALGPLPLVVGGKEVVVGKE
jgi:hypothetical protein